ncbi:MAG TPA: class I SAM-dependent methyltransferase [Stellaceae bacterium]|nr:class I SAM-dependent methyltransferase [Stellaceae bacterium]
MDIASPFEACRFCGGSLHSVVDLGMSPLCESFLTAPQLDRMEPFYPLHLRVCGDCFLAQLPKYVAPQEIFGEYAYFSSYSDAWLAHARDYVGMITERLRLDRTSQVVELASNDGYLLQYFVKRGIPALGIDPAANVAAAARARGVETIVDFFGASLAERLRRQGRSADLVIANNVLAQVPDLNDFVAGIAMLLKPQGVATVEFPHLMRLIAENQFDTIYHEHFSYFSLSTAQRIFARHGLGLFDVEELWSHGGSLRLYLAPKGSNHAARASVAALIERERAAGLRDLAAYRAFAERVAETKRRLLDLLIAARRSGKRIAGYGAPGKGNTLLNYCGIRTDFLDYTVDRNPYKHGKFLPGTHIPIFPPERIAETKPDYVLVLPWNLKDEILRQLAYIRDWGGRFILPIPSPAVLS